MRDFYNNIATCLANVNIIDTIGACDGSLCGDGIQNSDELGIDCGGSFCSPCTGCPLQRHFDNEIISGGTDELVDHRITTSGVVITDNNGIIKINCKRYILI